MRIYCEKLHAATETLSEKHNISFYVEDENIIVTDSNDALAALKEEGLNARLV